MTAIMLAVPSIILLAIAGFVVAGGSGAVIGALVATAAILVAVRAAMPRERRLEPPDLPPADDGFPRYRELSSMLSWSRHSDRYFNAVVRPVLADVASAVLVRSRRIDMGRDPAAAAAALGGPVWELVDPAVPLDAPVNATAEKVDAVLDTLELLLDDGAMRVTLGPDGTPLRPVDGEVRS